MSLILLNSSRFHGVLALEAAGSSHNLKKQGLLNLNDGHIK